MLVLCFLLASGLQREPRALGEEDFRFHSNRLHSISAWCQGLFTFTCAVTTHTSHQASVVLNPKNTQLSHGGNLNSQIGDLH